MQTFLPYSDYQRTASALDYKRLGKQRVEAKQILNALDGLSKGWVNHPATKMWTGYEAQLCMYAIEICKEWRKRGYNDSLLPFFEDRLQQEIGSDSDVVPHWLGTEALHISHQSNLVRKDPKFYIPIFGNIPDDLPYVWLEGK